jgi:hypothetical protein
MSLKPKKRLRKLSRKMRVLKWNQLLKTPSLKLKLKARLLEPRPNQQLKKLPKRRRSPSHRKLLSKRKRINGKTKRKRSYVRNR